MATRVELPIRIIAELIDNGISLRTRQIKATNNQIIADALTMEQNLLANAKHSLENIPEKTEKK